MTLKPGASVWIPCEVKPGPFSNERLVKVTEGDGDWVGFVNILFLQPPIESGRTKIKARVVSVEADRFSARLPGHSFKEEIFRGDVNKVAVG